MFSSVTDSQIHRYQNSGSLKQLDMPISEPFVTLPNLVIDDRIGKNADENNILYSPNGRIKIAFTLDNGAPKYSVEYDGITIINPSSLGFTFNSQGTMINNFIIQESSTTSFDETWMPVWGQSSSIRNHYNQLVVKLQEDVSPNRVIHLIFRAYDDGIGFRYELPSQPDLGYFEITSEETSFEFTGDHTAWWIPADWDSYEHLYSTTSLSYAATEGVNTPITLKTSEDLYLSIHEAALTDWAGMTLKRPVGGDDYTLKAELVPWYGSDIKVKASTPHKSPWRTIQIAESAGDLIDSNLILNLNDPCIIEDTSWIKPMKYMGIWWGMHRGIWTWEEGPNHGATTQRAKDYIDACTDLNCSGLLVEGWNKGWGNGWEDQDFTAPTDDYNIEEVIAYGQLKGVEIIGHIETAGNIENYENQGIDEVFAYFQQLGINAVKTGYAGNWDDWTCITAEGKQHHHGQWMVNHYRRVLESAAAHEIMVNVHEPIKPTGISRTYPNMMTREGGRGQEYNAWGNPPNPPGHSSILPFTRLLAGPMDYTPGVFDFNLDNGNRFSTLAHQLALYVILPSPLQMVCDLKESYYALNGDLKPECEFIKNVPVSWDETVALDCQIGDYTTIARRKGDKWYLGCITDRNRRILDIPLVFLDPSETYTAYIYADASDAPYAHYVINPSATELTSYTIDSTEIITAHLQPGGGLAIEFIPSSSSSSTANVPAFTIIFGVILPMVLIQIIYLKKKHHKPE